METLVDRHNSAISPTDFEHIEATYIGYLLQIGKITTEEVKFYLLRYPEKKLKVLVGINFAHQVSISSSKPEKIPFPILDPANDP
jgi:hypothetical protein